MSNSSNAFPWSVTRQQLCHGGPIDLAYDLNGDLDDHYDD